MVFASASCKYTRRRNLPPDAALQSLTESLNPEQRAAVEATEGPLLILAGAGSGKPASSPAASPGSFAKRASRPTPFLAVTFTNKAATEMAARVDRLLGHSSLAKPLIATFHSMCVRMLRRDIEALKVNGQGLTRSFAIYDENDQQGIVKQVMRRMGLDTKQLTPRTVLGRISWAKNHMVDPQEYYLGSKDPNSERIAHIYQSYKAELRKNNASTSTTCCSKPSACSRFPAKCASVTSAAIAIFSSTSTRTPIVPNTRS